MERNRKIIILSLNETVRVDEILRDLDSNFTFQSVIHEFEFYLSKHYYQFGNRPFTIEFAPLKGYVLRASSLIGKVSTDNFEIHLNPKFKDLSFGKCLAMAQYASSSILNISSNDLTKNIISNKYNYSTADYLGFGLVDAITTIINNGLARTFKDVINESVKIRGSIAIPETIMSGRGLLNPFINDTEADYNILPNRIIKTALQKLISTSKNIELKNASSVLINQFKEVKILEATDIVLDEFRHFFNLPRLDYEKALLYASSILDGGYIDKEGNSVELPSITLDLDQVFEQYISNKLKKLLGKDRFEVHLQKEIDHVSTPKLSSKSIIPDILIKDKKKNCLYVVDTKNKYSEIGDNGLINLSNSDVFQITYYCKTLETETAILLFPSVKPKFQFPIKGSESESAFNTKCKTAFDKMKLSQSFSVFKEKPINLIIYHIDLSGSLYDTEKSIASFCQLLIYLSENGKKN